MNLNGRAWLHGLLGIDHTCLCDLTETKEKRKASTNKKMVFIT